MARAHTGYHSLFIPGPTNIPDRILNAMRIQQEDQRNLEIPDFTLPLYEDMKKVLRTKEGIVFIYPSSGTGAWEAALSNTLSPGDKVLTCRFGIFSHLWIDMMERLGLDVRVIECEWGEGAPPDKIGEILAADSGHEIKGVMVVHNETTTGVTSDIAAVRKAIDDANHPALYYIDGISSIASVDFRMDEWGVDVAICGSQKGLMLPCGLGIVCAGPKALEAHKTAGLKRVYFSFEDMLKTNKDGFFPYTPAMPLLRGLREALNILFEEGLENVFKRHYRLAEGVRQAAKKGWGLKLCAKESKWESDTVTAIMVPEGTNGAEVIATAFKKYNLALGAGLAEVAGKLFRIGHLGDLNELMLCSAIAGVEMAMRDVGVDVEPGSGVGAACEYWRANPA